MHESSAAVPVEIELGGATEFLLEVSDAGNGIACDQADWADAKVVLADGKTVWLGDMPILSSVEESYDVEPFFSFKYDGKTVFRFFENVDFHTIAKKTG